MHFTSNLEDGYLGSGKIIKASIRKYGKENFKCEILEYCKDREELTKKEKELITEEILKDILCMNLKPRGSGGLCNEKHAYKFHANGGRAVRRLLGKRHHERMKIDLEYREKVCAKLKATSPHISRPHSEETKKLMCKNRKGTRIGKANSQFGTYWITKEGINKKIKKEELEIFISQGWKRSRNKPLLLK